MQTFHEFIKPGTKYPFMATAKYWIAFSATAVLLSLVLLFTKGLNLGIDFKGGTKLIVAFPETANANRDDVAELVKTTLQAKTGTDDVGQLEVQDFNVGTTNEKGQAVVKYQIYTEKTTLLNDAKTDELKKAVETALTATPVQSVERPEETDKLIILLKDPAPIADTKAKLEGMLKQAGFTHAEVVSEEEQSIDMEFYKEYNLSVVERSKDGVAISDDDYPAAKAKHDAEKATKLKLRTDKQYTVSLAQLQSDIESALVGKYGAENVQVESATSVSASVGSDLFSQGMLALIYAIIGILIYIGLRFDFRYSPGAVVALAHDAIFTLGIFALFGLKFTLPIVSAILTIIGFSINDTIVIYDRIRENMAKLKGMEVRKIVDISINETLSRTILTSLTAILSILPLIFLGGGFIRDFAIALTFGFTVGTYSSIFVAAPMTILLDDWQAERRARAGGSAPSAAAGA